MRRSRVVVAVVVVVVVVVIGLGLGLVTPAHAHQSSVSYHDIKVEGDGTVAWTVRLASRDLYEALGLERERDASSEEIRAGERRLVAYVTDRLGASADGHPCRFGAPTLSVLEQTTTRFAEIRLAATCPLPLQTLHLESHLFFDLDPRHSALLRVSAGGRTLTEELVRGAESFEWKLGLAAPASLGLLDYLEKGVEHIYTGYDHIAFVIGLLLVAAIRREPEGWAVRPFGLAAPYVLKVVTAFTLAHSLTLILAGLDVIQLPSRFVESAIAASIVFIAVENMAPREARHRWAVAYLFGLVHGLGFAAMLRPILPANGVVVPLLMFNVGVELGQLSIVAALLPLLLLFARAGARRYRRVVVLGGSAAVALLGFLWLVERVADMKIAGGLLG